MISYKNTDEPCVYKKTSRSGVVFLILYVFDILLIKKNDIFLLQFVKISLFKNFTVKDMSENNLFIGNKNLY